MASEGKIDGEMELAQMDEDTLAPAPHVQVHFPGNRSSEQLLDLGTQVDLSRHRFEELVVGRQPLPGRAIDGSVHVRQRGAGGKDEVAACVFQVALVRVAFRAGDIDRHGSAGGFAEGVEGGHIELDLAMLIGDHILEIACSRVRLEAGKAGEGNRRVRQGVYVKAVFPAGIILDGEV